MDDGLTPPSGAPLLLVLMALAVTVAEVVVFLAGGLITLSIAEGEVPMSFSHAGGLS